MYATVCPLNATNRSVRWSSDNPYIATVNPDSGLVTARNIGVTTIRCTAKDGSGVSAACTFSVKRPGWVQKSSTYVSNVYLNESQMKVNARYILDHFLDQGWTKSAACGVLGNFQRESTINPGYWIGGMTGAYGLAQWHAPTKYFDWADARGLTYDDIDNQLSFLDYHVETNGDWTNRSMTLKEFTRSNATPSELAALFAEFYERPRGNDYTDRMDNAEKWYTIFASVEPW